MEVYLDLNNILVHKIIIGEPDQVIKEYLETWTNLPKNWKIVVWDKEKIDNLIKIEYPEYIKYLQGFYNFGELTDFYRYLIVYHQGGMWVDWDISLNDIDKLKTIVDNNPKGYVVYAKDWLSLCSEHFFLPRKSKFLEDVIKQIIDINILSTTSIGTFYYTGGVMLRQVFDSGNYDINVLDSLDIFSHTYLEIRRNKEGRDTAMTHYWTNSWTDNPIAGTIK